MAIDENEDPNALALLRLRAALRQAAEGALDDIPTFGRGDQRNDAALLAELSVFTAPIPAEQTDPDRLRSRAAEIRRTAASCSEEECERLTLEASSLALKADQLEALYDWDPYRAIQGASFYTPGRTCDDDSVDTPASWRREAVANDRWNALLHLRRRFEAGSWESKQDPVIFLSYFSREDLVHLSVRGTEGRDSLRIITGLGIDAAPLWRLRQSQYEHEPINASLTTLELAINTIRELNARRDPPLKSSTDETTASPPCQEPVVNSRDPLSREYATVLLVLADSNGGCGLGESEIEVRAEKRDVSFGSGTIRNRVIPLLKKHVPIQWNRKVGYHIPETSKALAREIARHYGAIEEEAHDDPN